VDEVSWTHERARVASLSCDRAPDDPELQQARLNLRAERLAEHVQQVVAVFPPLTAAQLDRVAALLRPSSLSGGGDAP